MPAYLSTEDLVAACSRTTAQLLRIRLLRDVIVPERRMVLLETSSPADATGWTVYDDSSAAVAQSGVAASCAASSSGGGNAPSVAPTPASTSFCTGVAFGGANDGWGTDAFGTYSLAGVDASGDPYYEHASGTLYLYTATWMYGQSWWFISETNGAASGSWYAVRSGDQTPSHSLHWGNQTS